MTVALAENLSRVLDYLDELEGRQGTAADRRTEARRSHAMIVELLPLNDALQPCGPVRLGVSRDISRHGASLLAELPDGTKFVRAEFPIQKGEKIAVLIEVAWCDRFGSMSELGGPVVSVGRKPAKRGSQGSAAPQDTVNRAPV
jgi:hypothetical protein